MRGLLMLVCLMASIYAMSRMGETIPGGWVCASVNAGEQLDHSCTSEPGLQLGADHSYSWGHTRGMWQERQGVIRFSGLRATGKLNADGKLVTDFDRDGMHYRLTFYKRW